MLNNIFVPNTLICDEPGGSIDWKKITPYIEANFRYDEELIQENEYLRQLHAPYKEVIEGTYPLKLHEYFFNTHTGYYPDSEPHIEVPNNAIVLRYTYTNDGGLNDYLVLNRSQGYFCYDPNLDPQTEESKFFSQYDPDLVPCYICPKGEMGQILLKTNAGYFPARLHCTTSTIVLDNPTIYYDFTDSTNEYTCRRPAHFNTELWVLMFLGSDDVEPIARIPASIVNTIQNNKTVITLQLHPTFILPSEFYIEVL